LAINRVVALFGAGNDVLCLLYLFRCSVDDKHVLVGLQGDIVLQDAVLRNAETNQARANRTYTSNDNCAFETSNNPRYDWTGCKNRSESWYEEETRSEQQPPEATPECSNLALIHHAIAGSVIPDDMFIRVRISSYNRQALHIDAGLLEFLYSMLGLVVSVIDCRYRVSRVHFHLLFHG